jgi:hypothetical protein
MVAILELLRSCLLWIEHDGRDAGQAQRQVKHAKRLIATIKQWSD